MRTMNQALYELYSANEITYDDALSRTTDPEDLKRTFQRGTGGPAPTVGRRRAPAARGGGGPGHV